MHFRSQKRRFPKNHRSIEIPAETDIETAKSSYNNGILEITFKKKADKRKNDKDRIDDLLLFTLLCLLFNQTAT